MKKYALIVAGGKGLRMGGELPKQFLPIGNGQPVLMHTLNTFFAFDSEITLVLVLPKDHQPYWKSLCELHQFEVPHIIADGGDTRFASVKNGLAHVDGNGLVAVHDGVRPFVAPEVIDRCYEVAAQHKAVVPVVKIVETVRQLEADGSRTVCRDEYRLVQTPQVFDAALLLQAYAQPYDPLFTDDASVVEAMGVPVSLVPGNRENIKITTPFDLKVAKALL